MTSGRRPSPPTGPVGIREVAELAGVSPGTVSNALNRPERVASGTLEAVLAAVDALGFIPNQHARALTGAPTQLIGLIVLDLTSPFFMSLAQAVEAAARNAGYSMLLCNSENDADREAEQLRLLAAHRVTGAVVAPAHGKDPVATRLRDRVPLVLLDHDGGSDGCGVAVDHVAGARAATRHLLDLGHESLAFIAGTSDLRQFVQRAEGIRQELEASDLDPRTHLREVYVSDIGIEGGMEAAERLLAGDMPTAVLCGNDMLAFGVFRRLVRAGLKIPADVSLVGYDDIEFAADWIVPLTTVRQDTREMGRLAAELIIDHASAGAEHVHSRTVLTPQLVVRLSTGPRPQR